MQTSSQMRVPLVIVVGKVINLSAGQHLPTQCLRTLSGFSVSGAAPEFISPHQTAPTSIWWHTLSVAISVACLPVVGS